MQIENIQLMISLKNQLLYDMNHQKKSGVYGYIQRTLAYNSNRIEGSTLTPEQTASIFETGTIIGDENEIFRTKDIEETTGHFRMFNYSLQHLDEPLSIDMIKKMHYHLKVGVFEDMANGYPCGEFKNRRNIVSTINTSLPADVPAHMETLLSNYLKEEIIDIGTLAKFHVDYEHIHPFQDGNGRTGRMILFKESLKNNLIPIIIRDVNKPLYNKVLYDAQINGNVKGVIELFKREQLFLINQIRDFLEPYPIQSRKRDCDL